jgi:hypothetical protein
VATASTRDADVNAALMIIHWMYGCQRVQV